ncbi:MAG: hypothetical protein AB7G93_03240 [Bdellovibrionales bacterium]
MGVLLPFVLLWLPYFAVLKRYHLVLSEGHDFQGEYYTHFMAEGGNVSSPRIQFVVFGDSTARSVLAPKKMKDLFGVNLALNNGTAQTAYVGLQAFLARRPAPNCVLFATQYNYRRNYQEFFRGLVRYQVFGPLELQRMWFFSRAHDVFPANQMSWLSFTIASARAWLRLDEIPLANLDNLFNERGAKLLEREDRFEARLESRRGFQHFSRDSILPESSFFREELHAAFLSPFRPSPSEDFYIYELARLARANGIRFFLALLPVADSDQLKLVAPHIKARRQHLTQLAQNNADIQFIPVPETWPWAEFRDFTHLNTRGARRMTKALHQAMAGPCGRIP